MRIAIINLTAGGISGGHKKYLQNILPLFAAHPEIDSILCASPGAMKAADWLPAISKISYTACAPFRPFHHSPDAALMAALDCFSPDLLFIPVERYINYKDIPVVIMLQNMAPLTGVKTGSGFKEKLIAIARRYETKIALERASAVIVPTGYVKKFLIDGALVPAGKLTAVHYGQNSEPVTTHAPSSFPFVNAEFVFTAGSLESYRGLEDLILALPALKEQRPRIKLVVAGGSRPSTEKYFSKLKRLAAELKLSDDIAWLGNIPEEELSWCYSNCAAFAITSRMESFCFVALEALTHACNIVSADSACLPEILGETALYYRAGEHNDLSAALGTILSRTASERSNVSLAASARAKGFLWDNAVADMLVAFKKVLPKP